MAPTLIHLGYSPWSEKARWALDHHRVDCKRSLYLPMIGEPMLRLRTRRLFGRVSVPVLVGDGMNLTDSLDIARWADEWADKRGRGKSLRAADEEVRRWNERSEALMAAGRARTTERAADRDDVLRESLPPPMDKLGRFGLPIAVQGARFLIKKYRTRGASLEEHLATMDAVLSAMRDQLSGDYLLGDELSYADMAMAAAMQFVKPVDTRFIRLGPASVPCWTEPELRDRYPELLEWRDAVYARDRLPE